MLSGCSNCLDDSPVYPVIPRSTFVRNERVLMAEPPNFAAAVGPTPLGPHSTIFPSEPVPTFGDFRLQQVGGVVVGAALLAAVLWFTRV